MTDRLPTKILLLDFGEPIYQLSEYLTADSIAFRMSSVMLGKKLRDYSMIIEFNGVEYFWSGKNHVKKHNSGDVALIETEILNLLSGKN